MRQVATKCIFGGSPNQANQTRKNSMMPYGDFWVAFFALGMRMLRCLGGTVEESGYSFGSFCFGGENNMWVQILQSSKLNNVMCIYCTYICQPFKWFSKVTTTWMLLDRLKKKKTRVPECCVRRGDPDLANQRASWLHLAAACVCQTRMLETGISTLEGII